MREIRVGDYIEGIEQWGSAELASRHKMRILVKYIVESDNYKDYHGQADDWYKGTREGTVSDEYGEVKIIENETPFTSYWWELKEDVKERVFRRNWKSGDIVKHFKGTLYKIIEIGVDTETEKEVVIYKKLDDTGNVWVRPRESFESEVDKKKYPGVTQEWRFEKY